MTTRKRWPRSPSTSTRTSGVMMAKLINGLMVLRSEFDVVNPRRDHSSDGWIGDDRHARTISDHNPDSLGLVHAIDVDVDGVPMAKIVAWLVGRGKAGREARLQYVIFRRVIWSRSWGWTPRRYTGINPHLRHAHFSARHADVAGDAAPWGVAEAFGPHAGAPPAPPTPAHHEAVVGHAPGTRALVVGAPQLFGPDVAFVQRWIGPARAGQADGRYGPLTKMGVRWYQRQRSLTPDGEVGPVTWRNMGVRWTG
jgi:peptidoglycan hydrolase-like protein with peptidoglycan-binding domain